MVRRIGVSGPGYEEAEYELVVAALWLRDLESGNWPRGRAVASRQAEALRRIVPRLRERARALEPRYNF